MPNRVGDVDDGVALGSGDLLPYSGFDVSLSSSSSPSSFLARCAVVGHRGGSGRWKALGLSAEALIAERGSASPVIGGWGFKGDRGVSLHPTTARGCVGAAQGGARPCPRRDPLARSLPVLSVLYRRGESAWAWGR